MCFSTSAQLLAWPNYPPTSWIQTGLYLLYRWCTKVLIVCSAIELDTQKKHSNESTLVGLGVAEQTNVDEEQVDDDMQQGHRDLTSHIHYGVQTQLSST